MMRHPSEALRGAAVQALNSMRAHPACLAAMAEAGCQETDLGWAVRSPDPRVRHAANQLAGPLSIALMYHGLAQAFDDRPASQVGGAWAPGHSQGAACACQAGGDARRQRGAGLQGRWLGLPL